METSFTDNLFIEKGVCGIFLDKNPQGLCAGIAVIERYGMRGWVSEIEADASHPYAAIDKLLHLIFVSGNENLIFGASDKQIFDEIAVHFEPFSNRFLSGLFSIEEQNILFKEMFGLRTLLTPLEHLNLEERSLGAQALALAASVFERSDLLPLALPEILDSKGLMELGNNALEQLEIVVSDVKAPAVFKLVTSMQTPMGKRLGRFRLCMPITDPAELNRRFDWVDWVAPHADYLAGRLLAIGDMEHEWWMIGRFPAEKINMDSFRGSVAALDGLISYAMTHKLPIMAEWDEECAQWFDELKIRLDEPHGLKKESQAMGKLIGFIAKIDVAVTTALTSVRYGLCRPVIIETKKEENFLQLMGLRHLLVEQQGVSYIPNDIVMGSRDYLDLPYPSTVMLDSKVHDGADIHGVLLYGINSSGKSSLMKGIGISVLLAQAGFHVPAKAMKFSLFEGVYTRIMSRDNVAKSLSTFGVEMLELNAIFKHATAKTLVLGDEISHGTETLSAVAIVASTVMELARKGSLFLITTHLHQLSMIKELSGLRQMVSLHLSVHYDETTDRLVYDRHLRPGQGSSIYGLEFAQSLHMDPDFLRNAKRLRENLAKEYDVLELGHQKEYIKRYRDVVASECVICGALVRNQPRSFSAAAHHHLIPLCDRHRRMMAEGKIKVRGFIMTPQGLRLEYETLMEGI